MILSQEAWMELRAFRALAEAGATWAENRPGDRARLANGQALPVGRCELEPAGAGRRGPGPRKIDPYAHLVDGWLAKQPKLKAVTIYERLVAEHGFDGHYQRVKVYVRENRERLVGIPADPPGLHRRFEVLAGAPKRRSTGVTRARSRPRAGRCTPSASTWCCRIHATRSAAMWRRRTWPASGTATGGALCTLAACRRRSSMTGPRPWWAATSAAARHPAASRGGRVRQPLPVRGPAVRAAAATSQRPGRAAGPDRADPRAGWARVRLARGAGSGLPGLAATPPRSRPSHPRRGDRRACRTRPGRTLPAARAALCGV